MITKQWTHFFYLLFELYPLVYFIFALQDLQNSISEEVYVLVCKILIYLTFIFYFQFNTFSSDSGPELTREQFEKNSYLAKMSNWQRKIYATAKFIIIGIIIVIIIMIVSCIF